MAKKIKKQVRKATKNTSVEVSSPAAYQTTPSSLASRSSSVEFNPDYSQTIKDLKRIGLLAGSFFTLLVVISFFLR